MLNKPCFEQQTGVGTGSYLFLRYIFTDGWPIWSEPEHNFRIFVWTQSGLAGMCCIQRERLNCQQRLCTQTSNTNLELLSYFFCRLLLLYEQSSWTTFSPQCDNSGHQKHCAIKLLTATVLQLHISYHWIVNVTLLTVALCPSFSSHQSLYYLVYQHY